jgi:signal transduction histidine kinase
LRPFYRSRCDATCSTPGHGLGLSLVAAIARVHDASLVILDNQPGCRIVLRFESADMHL